MSGWEAVSGEYKALKRVCVGGGGGGESLSLSTPAAEEQCLTVWGPGKIHQRDFLLAAIVVLGFRLAEQMVHFSGCQRCAASWRKMGLQAAGEGGGGGGSRGTKRTAAMT